MSASRKHLHDFGSFRLDPTEHNLLHEGREVPLTPKVFEVLLMLVESNGRLVEKDDFFEQLWPDSFVEEGNLAKNISVLRKTLAENDPDAESFIETVPKLGYRFTAPVHRTEEPPTVDGLDLADEALISDTFASLRARMTLVAIVSISVLTSFGFWYCVKGNGSTKADLVGSLAVMPPEIVSQAQMDKEFVYLTDGLHDGLISKISQLPELVVKSKSAVASFKDEDFSPQQIGSDLEVGTILTVRFIPQGDELRVAFQLIDTKTGNVFWDRHYLRRRKDLFLLEREIAQALAKELRPGMAAADADRITRIYTENPAAYEAYLKGRFFGDRRTTEELQKAEKFYLEALKIDPNYALAWSGLADLYWWQTQSSESLRNNEAYLKMRLKAERSLYKALELAPDLAEARTSLATFKLYELDFEGSEREFRRAIELNPNYVRAHKLYSRLLSYTGKHEQALKEMKIAQTLSPVGISGTTLVARHYHAGLYEEAVKHAHKALELHPKDHATMHYLSMVLVQQKKYKEALELQRKVMALAAQPDSPAWVTQLAVIHAKSGNRKEARRILKKLIADERKGWVSPVRIAIVCAVLDERDAAFEWFDRAVQNKDSMLYSLKVNPNLKSLHSDERWPKLLRRVGLPE